jgi:hypothetical protein
MARLRIASSLFREWTAKSPPPDELSGAMGVERLMTVAVAQNVPGLVLQRSGKRIIELPLSRPESMSIPDARGELPASRPVGTDCVQEKRECPVVLSPSALRAGWCWAV